MASVKVLEGQSLIDIAIQTAGSIEALVELALLNGISITDELSAGQTLETTAVYDNDIYNYYKNKGITPATANDSDIVTKGVGYWVIGSTFKVS